MGKKKHYDVNATTEPTESSGIEHRTKKKAKKSKKDVIDKPLDKTSAVMEESVSPDTKSKRKKSKKRKHSECISEGDNVTCEVTLVISKKKKRKHEDSISTVDDDRAKSERKRHKKEVKKKKKDKSENNNSCEIKIKVKSSDKKHRKDKVVDSGVCTDPDSPKKDKKKKKKKKSLQDKVLVEADCSESSDEKDVQKNRSMNVEDGDIADDTDEDKVTKKRKKKKKNKDKNKTLENGTQACEVENKSEKDCESGNVSEMSNKVTGAFGQWGTSNIGNQDRQQKFLRLMGGFKASGKPEAGPVKKFNMAMDRRQQEKFDCKLTQDFEKARTMRIFGQKGGGLGYEAPAGEGKKFHIDTNNTKSIKFD